MYDVAVVGGGVNGCGIARDLAGRGLSVVLVEQGDLASGTSSASTKLIHGGLRYLEHYEFALVRDSLREREVLLALAPHIIWPLRFVLPHHRGLRPALLIRLGLFLYDHLGGRRLLPASRGLDLTRDPAGASLQPAFTRGFEYSDCWVDDARLVVLNAVDAARRGADIRVRTAFEGAAQEADAWRLDLRDRDRGTGWRARARILVNAAGPWVGEVAERRLGLNRRAGVRLVKGSHIIVPRLFAHDRAYIFQNDDRRIVFAIPYEDDFTLIGTTDVDYTGDPALVAATPDEIAYLCRVASSYFRAPVRPEDVVATYAGVRPLQDEEGRSAQAVSRDYVLDVSGAPGGPALVNVIGGKITTYRRLAEAVAEKLAPWIAGAGPPWTRTAPLPGAEGVPLGAPWRLADDLVRAHPGLDPGRARRLARTYGRTAFEILAAAGAETGAGAGTDGAAGRHFGAGLFQCEVEHLVRNEWARGADDVLWRRTKLGLRLSRAEAAALDDWIQANRARLLGGTG